MISIPGSISFAKLVMMSSAPAKSAGDARYASQDPLIHRQIDVVPYNLDSNPYEECVLFTKNSIKIYLISLAKKHANNFLNFKD